jgi:hypothetical protein
MPIHPNGISPPGFFKVKAGERMTIPGIQSGEYEPTIWIPGVAEWRGKPFKLAPNTPPVEVPLETGADVKISVLPPGSDEAIEDFRLIRINASEEWYSLSDCLQGLMTYHSLPKGKYTIHIPAPDNRKYGAFAENVPAYAARDNPFEITDNTPPVLKLGTIQLEAAR